MSVSEMNMSWSTASAQLSSKSLGSSTFLTSIKKDGTEFRKKPVSFVKDTMCGSRGGDRGPDPPGKLQNIGFLSNIGPDPLKMTMLPIQQHSMLGYHRHASETPFK